MDRYFAEQVKKTEKEGYESKESTGKKVATTNNAPKKLPKGVVLGKDGKPCRSCTSVADWAALTKRSIAVSSTPSPTSTAPTASSISSTSPPPECPPDVNTLGNHTWTLLHSISANYPPRASATQESEMKQFLLLFSKLYPCWVCADDFRDWMGKKGNEPKVEGRDGLGRWMCEAHNEVNRKLGKEEFDCGRWAERWREGWRDGSCD